VEIPAGIETMLAVTSEKSGSVEPMPPSGREAPQGAVDIYGHHEFHGPPPSVRVEDGAL
jgi:hypothetical protein